MSDLLENKKNIIELLKKTTKIETINDFKKGIDDLSSLLEAWKWDIRKIIHQEKRRERCRACQKFLGYPYFWDYDLETDKEFENINFLEINPMYVCDRCGEIYCEECGSVHKNRHIDEKRLEMLKVKKKYRENKLKKKTNKINNQKYKQTQLI